MLVAVIVGVLVEGTYGDRPATAGVAQEPSPRGGVVVLAPAAAAVIAAGLVLVVAMEVVEDVVVGVGV